MRISFCVVYRAGQLNESRRAAVKEWLDTLGRYLEMQPVSIGGIEYRLVAYPILTGTRRITKIGRTAPAVQSAENENGTEDWLIQLSVTYNNDF